MIDGIKNGNRAKEKVLFLFLFYTASEIFRLCECVFVRVYVERERVCVKEKRNVCMVFLGDRECTIIILVENIIENETWKNKEGIF